MAIPSSGQVSGSDVNVDWGLSAATQNSPTNANLCYGGGHLPGANSGKGSDFYTLSGVNQATALQGSGAGANAHQGFSTALSLDGNTMISGAPNNAGFKGTVWTFTRSGTTWAQQAGPISSVGGLASENFGVSVALSSDGNTAIVGAYGYNGSKGAIYILTRSGTTWSQQAGPLTGTGGTVGDSQGFSVAISSDGNTAACGAVGYSSNVGACWVFTRSGTSWSQQAGPLVGSGYSGTPQQGNSISLSYDGNTLAIGGSNNQPGGNLQGATWVFTRSGTSWSQQAGPLVGTGGTVNDNQGSSVSLSLDGNTLAVGGSQLFGSVVGAVWVFTRSGTTWSQQAGPLVGSSYSGSPQQGTSVSLSADGNIFVSGGPGDNGSAGAIWIFTRLGTTWSQRGGKITGSSTSTGIKLSLSGSGSTLASGVYPYGAGAGAVQIFV